MSAKKNAHDPKFIERVRNGVRFFCQSTGISEDDMFQSVYLKYLEGKRNKSTVDQVCIDVYREWFGTKRRVDPSRRQLFSKPDSFDSLNSTEIPTVDDSGAMLDAIGLEECLSRLTDLRALAMVILRFRGFNLKEIGNLCGGVSASLVAIILKEAAAEMKRQTVPPTKRLRKGKRR